MGSALTESVTCHDVVVNSIGEVSVTAYLPTTVWRRSSGRGVLYNVSTVSVKLGAPKGLGFGASSYRRDSLSRVPQLDVRTEQMSVSLEETLKAAIESIDALLGELEDIVASVRIDRDHKTAKSRLTRWRSRTITKLETAVGKEEARKFKGGTKIHVLSYVDLVGNVAKKAETYKAHLTALREELESHPENVLSTAADVLEHLVQRSTEEINLKSVFLIHGRDEANLFKLRDLLTKRWGLEPKVLKAEAWGGRTLIEKFEEEAQEAVFAVALITPDDTVRTSDAQYVQGRPNVIFELGWFYGRLGRKRVTIVLNKGTQLHSDLDGVGRVEFGSSVEEVVLALEEELKAAGMI